MDNVRLITPEERKFASERIKATCKEYLKAEEKGSPINWFFLKHDLDKAEKQAIRDHRESEARVA